MACVQIKADKQYSQAPKSPSYMQTDVSAYFCIYPYTVIIRTTVFNNKEIWSVCGYLKKAVLLVSTSGETYCAVPTNELVRCLPPPATASSTPPIMHTSLIRLAESNIQYIKRTSIPALSNLRPCLIFWPNQNLLFECAFLHSAKYFPVSSP